jgi:carbon storage regulator
MLILSRRPNESLRIGGNVVITVVGFSGNQIRLGITAPPKKCTSAKCPST